MGPYCIPEKRLLREDERAFLQLLLEEHAPDRLPELRDLVIVARCGCGTCPGVLFGANLNDQPVTSTDSQPIVDVNFPDAPQGYINVMIWATESRISELELICYGDVNLTALPDIKELGQGVAA